MPAIPPSILDELHSVAASLFHYHHDRTFAQALIHILRNQESIMATLEDILNAANADLAKAEAEGNALTAIKGILESQQAKIADLTTQLSDAIANGADPAKLQSIADALTQTNTALDTNAAAEAALANTAPTPSPAPVPTPPVVPPAQAPVSVSSITPASGMPGTSVNILGAGFAAATIHGVLWGDVTDSAGVTIANDTSIIATVPAGLPAGSLDVSLVVDGGNISAGTFTVEAAPQAQAADAAGQQAPAA